MLLFSISPPESRVLTKTSFGHLQWDGHEQFKVNELGDSELSIDTKNLLVFSKSTTIEGTLNKERRRVRLENSATAAALSNMEGWHGGGREKEGGTSETQTNCRVTLRQSTSVAPEHFFLPMIANVSVPSILLYKSILRNQQAFPTVATVALAGCSPDRLALASTAGTVLLLRVPPALSRRRQWNLWK